jgi:sulfofructosephosphate aldolase
MPASEPALDALAGPSGVLCTLALDHRAALRNAYRRAGVRDVSDETMLEVKKRIAGVLGGRATGILLDPDAIGCRPPGVGLLVPLEEQEYEALDGGRLNRLMEDFGAREARGLGADGCKLLLHFRADHPTSAQRQREVVERAAIDCYEHGLPLVLEPLVYRLEGEPEDVYADAYPGLVVEGARALADSGADLLKLQFPSAAACRELTEASSPLPWALLGGSDVDGETFAGQLETACRAGAAGFIAGRAVWGGALSLPAEQQERWLVDEALPLFERMCAIAEDLAVGIAH